MPLTETLDNLKEHLTSVQSAIVMVGADPTYDQVASALALVSALQASGKEVGLVSPAELPSITSSLVGTEQVQQKLGNQNLSIKFPYQAEAVDKVSYNISDDNQTFYLVIKPQKGYKPLDISQVSFDYTGAETDMIFLVGVHQFEALEHLYTGFEELYERVPVVSIHTFETEIGNLKIDTSKYAAYSQAMVFILQYLQLPVSPDAATNLLSGIELVTDGFASSLTTADTFETVAQLIRQGARRVKPQKQSLTVASASSGTNSDGHSSNQAISPFSAALKKAKTGEVQFDGAERGNVDRIENNQFGNGQKKKKAKKNGEVGGLDYQPGAEGGVGRG
jgi:hypothetical protein